MNKIIIALSLLLSISSVRAGQILIPMDFAQKEHLKAYGVTYYVLERQTNVDWLLNYRGGSFMFPYAQRYENELVAQGVSFEKISDAKANQIIAHVTSNEVNMDAVKLETPPKVAVYTPSGKQPWDDAVTLVLAYANIPYEEIYDEEVLDGKLAEYDWLHLHHEDFTGQYGKFWRSYRNAPWYKKQVAELEASAKKLGFKKVSQMKLTVAKTIKAFVARGGFLFAMCSATDSYDIALAAEGVDICAQMFDHDPADPNAQSKLDFSKSLAFENFQLVRNPGTYEFSDIDVSPRTRGVPEKADYFSLFEFSAKWDPVPTMLCQNHKTRVKGFWGQTTAFKKKFLKSDVLIMGELKSKDEARYIHGILERGMWTFYAGHDPEDYRHTVGEDPTDLLLHPQSPGYRLILNNILFPAARKKKRKT